MPETSLWRWNISIRADAVLIETSGGLIAGTVRLTTWLNPDESVDVAVVGDDGWAGTESSIVNVAPVTTLETDVLLTGTTLVNDELVWEPTSLQEWSEGGDVAPFAPVWIIWARSVDWVWGGGVVGVVVGDVGGVSTESAGTLASKLTNLGEEVGSGLQVTWPSEPVGVTNVDIELEVLILQLADGVGDTGLVEWLGGDTLWNVQVGDKVWQAVWLNNDGKLKVWVLLEDLDDGVDEVLLVLVKTTVGKGDLTGGGSGSAVTLWQVVDDQRNDDLLAGLVLLLASILEMLLQALDLYFGSKNQ